MVKKNNKTKKIQLDEYHHDTVKKPRIVSVAYANM